MRRLRIAYAFGAAFSLIVCLTLAGVISQACAGSKPPILSPGAATSLSNGLSALATILRGQNVNPIILNAISDAQVAIAADVSGKTWGEITRELLGKLYEQLSPDILTKAWPVFAAIEVVLATIGA
jgi:hypothetical protein